MANVTGGCELCHIHAARFLQGWCRGTGSWLVRAIGNAVPLILKALNLPSCRTSDVYRGTQSNFKKEGGFWREYPLGAVDHSYQFEEINRTRDVIMLRNLTPRDTKDWETLRVHLPACDGTAKLSEGLPERWTGLQLVWRAPRES